MRKAEAESVPPNEVMMALDDRSDCCRFSFDGSSFEALSYETMRSSAAQRHAKPQCEHIEAVRNRVTSKLKGDIT
ncbi:hypothetical protein [Nitrosomonas ureae]|uniref:hypothetical protein n=1 Tax=Nitrosomonas ureae TaxID=44577 RepID=UPI000BB73937|nr:hypothetical protein [Nitrosomonas ureae]